MPLNRISGFRSFKRMEARMADKTLTPDQCADLLAKSLKAQTEVCLRILDKSKKQQKLVEESNETELLSLLSDKQKLIQEHDKLVKDIGPVRDRWEQGERDRASKESHAKVEEAWSGLRDVLDQVVKLEDASRAVLEAQKNRLSIDIGNLQRGKIVNKAYGSTAAYRPPTPPRYSDRKG